MLSFCLIWCIFVVLGYPNMSSAAAFWWSLHWSLNRSLTVYTVYQYIIKEPLSLKRELNASANSINQNFLLLVSFQHNNGPHYLIINLVVKTDCRMNNPFPYGKLLDSASH